MKKYIYILLKRLAVPILTERLQGTHAFNSVIRIKERLKMFVSAWCSVKGGCGPQV